MEWYSKNQGEKVARFLLEKRVFGEPKPEFGKDIDVISFLLISKTVH